MTYTATYEPTENKLRLYASSRLDAETYARVKGAGFSWAPKQELFVAPMWTPAREDLLLELAGEITDEDTSLVERAEERSERFEDYGEKRAEESQRAHKAVSAIADGIPLGQPILVGHHSERHARRDAEKIEAGMRKAVNLWKTSQYWEARAKGAIRHAKYKELPAVRHRRIKGIEADKRKLERSMEKSKLALEAWQKEGLTRERALFITNYLDHNVSRCFTLAEFPRELPKSQYEGMMSLWSALDDEIITAEQARDLAIPAHERGLERAQRWIEHYENRLTYEKAMLGESGGIVADRTGPEKGGACKCWAGPRGGWAYIQKVNKVSVTVLDNWGNGGGNFTRTIPFDKLSAVMTKAEVEAARSEGRLVECEDKTGFLLGKLPTPAEPENEEIPEPLHGLPFNQDVQFTKATDEDFRGMAESLRAGVKVVSAPQLFVTPRALADRMVELADLRPGQCILEPSAGTGALVDAVRRVPNHGCAITAVEINYTMANRLETVDCLGREHVRCSDFLECNGDLGRFERILMNPPFANGADIKHIQHALTFLTPGGRLVAICANGPRQNAILKPLVEDAGGNWEELPAGTFEVSGTGVNTVLLTFTKEIAEEPTSQPEALLNAEADPEYQSRIDADRCTWQFSDKLRAEKPQESIEDLPIFGGKRQGEMFTEGL